MVGHRCLHVFFTCLPLVRIFVDWVVHAHPTDFSCLCTTHQWGFLCRQLFIGKESTLLVTQVVELERWLHLLLTLFKHLELQILLQVLSRHFRSVGHSRLDTVISYLLIVVWLSALLVFKFLVVLSSREDRLLGTRHNDCHFLLLVFTIVILLSCQCRIYASNSLGSCWQSIYEVNDTISRWLLWLVLTGWIKLPINGVIWNVELGAL